MRGFSVRHARAGGHPGTLPRILWDFWIPAFAGMTTLVFFQKPSSFLLQK
jgi:hypothetical protein